VLWGPMAGYYAKLADADYTVVPLVAEGPGPALAYRITMGVRASDQEWKRTLNRAIRDYQGEINEILLAYGGVHFASKMGQLAGNHFITLTSGLDRLAQIGPKVLWEGAQDIRFELA